MEQTFTIESADTGDPKAGPPDRARTITNIFFILFCVEIGLVLFLLPWTLLWDNNYFFSLTPQWSSFWLSTYLRGAVSGVGVVNLWIGLAEAWRLWH
jgi:hypothetical protein